jgi:hypothetical protein
LTATGTEPVSGSQVPVVAVLAAHWESKSEGGWFGRQVAGALACEAEVHVITPDGAASGHSSDGPFTLHRLATPIDSAAEMRRELLVASLSLSGGMPNGPVPTQLVELLDRDLLEPWADAAKVLASVQPDRVVIVGHENVGALAALDAAHLDAPMTLVALGSSRVSVGFPRFKAMFERADSVIAATETERQFIIDEHGSAAAVFRVGAPLAANPSALSEPNTWVGTTDYIVVVTNSGAEEHHEETDLSRLIRLSFPDNPVGVCHTDCFRVWHQGRLSQGWAVERYSDMTRLMAWARVTVDLHPEALFSRRSVDSLLYGTPIIVPEASMAREHADRGRGGLWFSDPAELTWCVEALLDPATRDTFGAQGRQYAEAEYGSTEAFIDRVLQACNITADVEAAPITA